MRERQKACLLSAERIGTRNYYCNEANNWKSCYRSLELWRERFSAAVFIILLITPWQTARA
jgi:hypothetical protein